LTDDGKNFLRIVRISQPGEKNPPIARSVWGKGESNHNKCHENPTNGVGS